MDVDGTDQVRLTSGETNDGVHGLAWSPDGSKIVFVSNRDQGSNSATGNYEDENLYLMDVPQDGDNIGNIKIQNLTSAIHQCPAGENYRNPAWSKDNQLAFAAMDCTINWDIFTFSLDNALSGKAKDIQYVNLTRRENEDGALGLSWSPDASKIIFVSNHPEVTNATSEDIFVVNVPETLKANAPQIVQLTDDPNINNSYGFPAWQPKSAPR
jgi:Tol biopolymer transport system component